MTANDSKSYCDNLDQLVDEYNNTYHWFIGKKAIDADQCALNEEIETNHKAPIFKVDDRLRITNHKNIFRKGYTKNCLFKNYL